MITRAKRTAEEALVAFTPISTDSETQNVERRKHFAKTVLKIVGDAFDRAGQSNYKYKKIYQADAAIELIQITPLAMQIQSRQ